MMAWYCFDCFKVVAGGDRASTQNPMDGHHSYCDECGNYDKLIEYTGGGEWLESVAGMFNSEPEWSTEVPKKEGRYWMCGYVEQSGPFYCIRVDVIEYPRSCQYLVHFPNGGANAVGVGMLERRTIWQPMVTPDAPNLEDYLDQLPTAKLLWERRKR